MSSFYITPDLLEEIFLRLPLKSIIKLRTVSKQWRSILESKRFSERRMNTQKECTKILVVGGRPRTVRPPFKGDEVVELFCLQRDEPSLTCEGLVCIPVPGCVNVLNPSTGELLSFPSGRDRVNNYVGSFFGDPWWNAFPGYWSISFGKDKVDGTYKVVRIFCDTNQFDILDVNTGGWQKLSPPPHYMELRLKSACVNGSIYWLEVVDSYKILALDLYTQVFRNVSIPPYYTSVPGQIVNLDDRLTITTVFDSPHPHHCNIQIWSMDALDETWSKTYSIRLFESSFMTTSMVRPLTLSKQGNLLFHDNKNRLFKYYPKTDSVRCLDAHICVISPFVENLFPLPRPKVKLRAPFHQAPPSRMSNFFRKIKSQLPKVFIVTCIVFLAIPRSYFVSSRPRS